MRGSYLDTGVIVKTLDYKEADKIISIVTKNHGLVHYLAVGARRMNSKKSPHLDLFSHVKFSVATTDHQSILTQVESLDFYSSIKNSLKKIGIAMSFLEIIYNLLPTEQEDMEIYSSLLNFLNGLSRTQSIADESALTKKFGSYLLRHLGYPPPPTSSVSLSSYFESLMSRKIIGREIS